MPNRKRIRRFQSAVIAAALALAVTAPASWARHTGSGSSGSGSEGVAVDCTPGPVSQAFAEFGDPNWYYLAPGGDFEGGPSWDTSGYSGLLPFSSPLNLLGVSIGNQSLGLGRNAVATSPVFCVTSNEPHVRMVVASNSSGGDRELEITVRLHDADGDVTDKSERKLEAYEYRGTWKPSKYIYLRTDELRPGETALMDLRVRSRGEWAIDDVFIDPYRRG
jgi:hypothetical protein